MSYYKTNEWFWVLLENKINELNGNLTDAEIITSDEFKEQIDSKISRYEYIWEKNPLEMDEIKDLVKTMKNQNLLDLEENF